MDMYDAMAKSGPAGSTKVMDVGIYKRGEAGEGIVTSTNQVGVVRMVSLLQRQGSAIFRCLKTPCQPTVAESGIMIVDFCDYRV